MFASANAKVLFFALPDAKVPNTSTFASQWNIGLKICLLMEFYKIRVFLLNSLIVIIAVAFTGLQRINKSGNLIQIFIHGLICRNLSKCQRLNGSLIFSRFL